METLGSSEANILMGKGETKKTSLASSRSKSRQLRRSHPAIDNDDCNVANNHSVSVQGVSIRYGIISIKCLYSGAIRLVRLNPRPRRPP